MAKKELPVFFDQSGKRWRRTKIGAAGLLVSVVAAVAFLIPPALKPAGVSSNGSYNMADAPTTQELEKAFTERNVPVIGEGPFIRAVRVDRGESSGGLRDALSGKYIRGLNAQEAAATGTHTYAFERFGKLPDRQIVLTFDDGPDPVYTPKVLDLLSKYQVPAVFFVVGANVAKHPDVMKRIAREGHIIGNHTFSHIDFDFKGTAQANQEIIQTERVIRATSGHQTAFMRVPYAGDTDEAQRDNAKGILQAQRLGYIETSFDYDSNDWTFKTRHDPSPQVLNGKGMVMLLHDAGGDRTNTLNYLEQLIPRAKEAGYTFVGLDDAYPGPPLQNPVSPTLADKTSLAISRTLLVWPERLMYGLFAFSVLLMFAVTGTNIVLALAGRRRERTNKIGVPRSYKPKVSVLVPAYNEGAVLQKSVHSLLASRYKRLEVVIIDDGSTDDTLQVAKMLSARYARVSVLGQPNSGKATALNKGLRYSSGEIIISIDADTVFDPNTVGRLARHFYDPEVGAVAGTVRVGNIRNLLTRWQALEYITSIAIERAAQAFLGAIMVVPGACGAWRRSTLKKVGGFSDRTLAEDCDEALSVHEAGYKIVQDTTAVGYTESPMSLNDLAKQRFRWIFGNIQSYWKHRNIFFNRRFGWLGLYVLPVASLTLLLPLLFWPLLFGVVVSNIISGNWLIVLLFPVVIMLVQTMVAFVGLRFAGESLRYLAAVPLTRLVYGPLRTYILGRTIITVLRGALVGWNKLKRTNTITAGRTRSFRINRRVAKD